MSDDWKDKLKLLKKDLEKKQKQTGSKSVHDTSKTTEQKPQGVDIPGRTPPLIRKPLGQPKQLPRKTTTRPVIGKAKNPKFRFPEEPRRGDPKGYPLLIGIDFGTSTTKVCARLGLDLKSKVPVYAVSLESKGYLCPSVISVDTAGNVNFGSIAEDKIRGGAAGFRHLKVCLACEAECPTTRILQYCSSISTAKAVCSGKFEIIGSDTKLNATDLVIVFLAWVMKEARSKLPSQLNRPEYRISYNLSVPIDQVDSSSPLSNTYIAIANAAWRVSEGIYQGMPIAVALEWVARTHEEGQPPVSERRVQLCPETMAALISYVNTPSPRIGLYGLVDIGAWTTDVSFFELSDLDLNELGVRKIAFYSAGTHRVAADQIDELTAHFLNDLWEPIGSAEQPNSKAELVQLVRIDREKGKFGDAFTWRSERRNPEPTMLETSRLITAASMRRSFFVTFGKAFPKEQQPQVPKWNGMPILLLGGGAQEKCFSAELKKRVPLAGRVELIQTPPIHKANGQMAEDPNLFARMVVAYGLAFHEELWPKRLMPTEVAVAEGMPIRAKSDRDYLYPK